MVGSFGVFVFGAMLQVFEKSELTVPTISEFFSNLLLGSTTIDMGLRIGCFIAYRNELGSIRGPCS